MTSYYARTSNRRRASASDWGMGPGSMMNLMQRKPEALLLIGAGLALMMREGRGFGFSGRSMARRWRQDRMSSSSGGRGRSSYQPTGEDGSEWSQSRGMMSSVREGARSAAQGASEAAEGMTQYASDMARRVSDTASNYAAASGRWAGDAREGLMHRSQRLAERARSLPEEVDEAVQDHPLVLAALGVAIGAALGATLPSTSIENRTMGEARDQMLEAAQGVTGRLGEAAEEAYDEALRKADSKGLNNEGLQEMARDVGAKFASAAAGQESGSQPSQGSSSGASSSGASGGGAASSSPSQGARQS